MNIHSHRSDMSSSHAFPHRRGAEDSRRERILDAAERAFVRHGFHAATMQLVADEAEMSAGNLYRYFPSKEAIVEGLCALDQEGRATAFAELLSGSDNLAEAIQRGLRDHIFCKSTEKARMIVEIWAESGRNARVSELTRAMDADVLDALTRLADAAKAAGDAAPALDSRFAARFLFTFVAGLFKRMAIEPDFDRAAETAMACGVLKALFAGALAPSHEDTL
jgi:TetR/AcrR family transcriptional regulator, repressor for uid operon